MAASANTTPWEAYPFNLPFSLREANQQDRHERLETESTRLFSGQDNIEIWRLDPSSTLLRTRLDWDHHHAGDDFTAYFIRQRSTWGYLQISKSSLKRILHTHQFPSVILDAVMSFGSKVTHEDDPFFSLSDFQSSNLSTSLNRLEPVKCLDICYIMRRYEQHGRSDLKQPWSLRQMMVSQKRILPQGRDCWIFVQPFQQCRDALLKRLPLRDHPLSVHALLLTVSLSTWRFYLNDLRRSVADSLEKVTHSSLTVQQVDYQTSFVDSQELELLYNDLAQSSVILQATMEIAQGLHDQCKSIDAQKLCPSASSEDILQSLASDMARIEGFHRTAQVLSARAKSASQLLLKLLQFRNADVQTSHADALRRLATAASSQSNSLRSLNERMHRDARFVRILTFVAMAYLPASLLAALFSTNIVRIPPQVNQHDSGLVVVDEAIWIYVVSSVLLTACTGGIVYLLNVRGS